jgi:hypothetical protein
MRYIALSVGLLLLILLLNASNPAAAQGASAVEVAGSSGKTTCSLNIQGFSAGDGIKSASLSCTGAGSVTVTVHKQLQQVLMLKGVKIADKGTCQLKPGGDPCLLLLCRSDAVFIEPVITGVKYVGGVWRALCLASSSKVTLRKGRFTSCGMPPIGIVGYETSVLVDQCSVQGNSPESGGAGMYIEDATVRVQSSTFKGNLAGVATKHNGGAISAALAAKLTIVDSTFHSNEAYNGGAVIAIENATVSIQGSQFVGNMANWSGAAVYAESNARVDILPPTKPGM